MYSETGVISLLLQANRLQKLSAYELRFRMREILAFILHIPLRKIFHMSKARPLSKSLLFEFHHLALASNTCTSATIVRKTSQTESDVTSEGLLSISTNGGLPPVLRGCSDPGFLLLPFYLFLISTSRAISTSRWKTSFILTSKNSSLNYPENIRSIIHATVYPGLLVHLLNNIC